MNNTATLEQKSPPQESAKVIAISRPKQLQHLYNELNIAIKTLAAVNGNDDKKSCNEQLLELVTTVTVFNNQCLEKYRIPPMWQAPYRVLGKAITLEKKNLDKLTTSQKCRIMIRNLFCSATEDLKPLLSNGKGLDIFVLSYIFKKILAVTVYLNYLLDGPTKSEETVRKFLEADINLVNTSVVAYQSECALRIQKSREIRQH